MSTPLLTTKLYIPPSRPKGVLRPRLIERLSAGLRHNRKLTLIAAPAGFGKTSLVSSWVASCDQKIAWLSLDNSDSDPIRFLTYFVAALQKIAPNIGEGVQRVLQSLQPPPIETILTNLLNEIATITDNFVFVLDDYHVIEAKPVAEVLTFLLDHLPSQMHLVIATREDPNLPLARLRVRDQLTELRAADLRFTPAEASEFLKEVMGLDLSEGDIAALEERTEGWIAGLQLAAISMQGHKDTTGFINSFTGNHHFILDYLLEEVLQQQSAGIQTFLLHTSILDRLCGSLCDAVLSGTSASGQETLEYLEHANLFIVPLDNERRWYRYHHLFTDLLRQRLHQSADSFKREKEKEEGVAELHIRASQWFEDNGLNIEAFQHAVAANDIERAERLIQGKGVPLHFRGEGGPVLNWLEALPRTALDARPSLWVIYASTLFFSGQHTTVEHKLQAAEAALQSIKPEAKHRDLVGRIASLRATLAVIQHDVESIITQSRRALEYLHSDNILIRSATTYTLGHAYQQQGDRAAASRAFTEIISISKLLGNSIYTTAATISLGQVQETDNQLSSAVETYRRAVLLAGDPPGPIACEVHLGLARIYYQRNELEVAQQHAQQSFQLLQQMESVDTFVSYGVFLARLRLAQDDVAGAVAILYEAEEYARRHNFLFRMNDVAAVQILTMLHLGKVAQAALLAQAYDLSISLARVHLAQGNPARALALLGPFRQKTEARHWADERLKIMLLQAVAWHASDETDKALLVLGEALALAEPGGFIRIFIDEGRPMADLLSKAAALGIMPDYTEKLLAVFGTEKPKSENKSYLPSAPTTTASSTPAPCLIEPLSQRELEVLQLMARGLSNHEISQRLFLALNTVKGHNQKIFAKLEVQRRTEAVARARELGLLVVA